MNRKSRRMAASVLALSLLLVPSAVLAQSSDESVATARQAAVRSAQIANETALAARSGDGKKSGLEKAAQAVQAAAERGNGNGRALGRGHAAKVLAALAAGESPAGLGAEHGKAVSAAAKGLVKVAGEKGNKGNGNGWGKGGNPNKGSGGDS